MTNDVGSSPQVSVLIVCHNDGKWLPRCLDSLRAQTFFDKLEIIIVDNASQDGSDRLAQELIAGWPRARFLSTGGDYGFCVGVNRATGVAGGKYLFVLNPDTWLEPDCIEQLYQEVERHHAGAGGPTVLNYEDNSLQSECPAGFDFCGNLMLPPAGKTASPPFSAGGFFFVRRELFNKIGRLDEKFFMYCEEQDLAWRIWIAKEEIVAVPAARIHHRGAVGLDSQGVAKLPPNRTSAQKRFLANRNRLLVISKNCQNFLCAMLLPCAAVVLLEGFATWVMTKSLKLAKEGCFAALADLWRLRGHVGKQRRFVASFRRRSDFWMLQFFRLGFGRWSEVTKIIRAGFPDFN